MNHRGMQIRLKQSKINILYDFIFDRKQNTQAKVQQLVSSFQLAFSN